MAQFSRRYARIEKAREQTLDQIYKAVEGEEEEQKRFEGVGIHKISPEVCRKPVAVHILRRKMCKPRAAEPVPAAGIHISSAKECNFPVKERSIAAAERSAASGE